MLVCSRWMLLCSYNPGAAFRFLISYHTIFRVVEKLLRTISKLNLLIHAYLGWKSDYRSWDAEAMVSANRPKRGRRTHATAWAAPCWRAISFVSLCQTSRRTFSRQRAMLLYDARRLDTYSHGNRQAEGSFLLTFRQSRQHQHVLFGR